MMLFSIEIPNLSAIVWTFVLIHVCETAGYFYFKKNNYLNSLWFKRAIMVAKVLLFILAVQMVLRA